MILEKLPLRSPELRRRSLKGLEPEDVGVFEMSFPYIVAEARNLDRVSLPCGPEYRCLREQEPKSLQMKRWEAASINAAAFLGLLQCHSASGESFDLWNLVRGSAMQPYFRSLMAYFVQFGRASTELREESFGIHRVCCLPEDESASNPSGPCNVRLTRPEQWFDVAVPVPMAPVNLEYELTIDETGAPMRSIFANEFVGGGVLRGARAQEEIAYFARPECLMGVLMCDRMNDNEVRKENVEMNELC